MRLVIAICASALSLAGCASNIPDSAAGVGEVQTAGTVPAAAAVSAAPLGASGTPEGAAIAAEATAALGLAPAQTAASALPAAGAGAGTIGAPMSAMSATSAVGAAPATMANASTPDSGTPVAAVGAAISDEQSFAAVSSRETIQSDAERLAENRAKYIQIEPTQLPERAGGGGASIVQYALQTNNPKGQQMYSRSGIAAQARFERNCGKYASSDLAQEAFLDAGGPKRDPKGMDPDGDGFACYWDPAPFRTARQGAPEVVTKYVDVETPGISE